MFSLEPKGPTYLFSINMITKLLRFIISFTPNGNRGDKKMPQVKKECLKNFFFFVNS